jgi:sugar transferase (PEP-CTERM/EpsH1 system associated)
VKVLIIAPRFPYPIEKGDKLRLYHQIRILSRSHSIHLIALSDVEVEQKHIEHLQQYVESIQVFRQFKIAIYLRYLSRLFSKLPLQVLYFYNENIHRKIEEITIRIAPDVIYNQLIRTTEYTRKLKGFKVLDYMDAFSTGMHNRLDNSKPPFKWIYGLEKKRLLKYEALVYDDFDAHTIISEQDKDRMPIGDTSKNIDVIPNGVDTEYFNPQKSDKKYDICFVGNMGYRPNIIAAELLCQEILPPLYEKYPDLKVLIAGARPHQRVKMLKNKHVHISGWLEDIRQAYNESEIFVAPIFTGIGQQNKVLEAMSMGMSVICTPNVNHPIGSIPGKEVLVAENNSDFRNNIATLLDDGNKRGTLGKNSRIFVRNQYSWETQVEKLNKIFERKNDVSRK